MRNVLQINIQQDLNEGLFWIDWQDHTGFGSNGFESEFDMMVAINEMVRESLIENEATDPERYEPTDEEIDNGPTDSELDNHPWLASEEIANDFEKVLIDVRERRSAHSEKLKKIADDIKKSEGLEQTYQVRFLDDFDEVIKSIRDCFQNSKKDN